MRQVLANIVAARILEEADSNHDRVIEYEVRTSAHPHSHSHRIDDCHFLVCFVTTLTLRNYQRAQEFEKWANSGEEDVKYLLHLFDQVRQTPLRSWLHR